MPTAVSNALTRTKGTAPNLSLSQSPVKREKAMPAEKRPYPSAAVLASRAKRSRSMIAAQSITEPSAINVRKQRRPSQIVARVGQAKLSAGQALVDGGGQQATLPAQAMPTRPINEASATWKSGGK